MKEVRHWYNIFNWEFSQPVNRQYVFEPINYRSTHIDEDEMEEDEENIEGDEDEHDEEEDEEDFDEDEFDDLWDDEE